MKTLFFAMVTVVAASSFAFAAPQSVVTSQEPEKPDTTQTTTSEPQPSQQPTQQPTQQPAPQQEL